MLKWKGTGFLPGIPARDLTDQEVEEFGGEKYLVGTGLYEKPEDEKTVKMTTKKSKNTTLTVDRFETPAEEDEKGE